MKSMFWGNANTIHLVYPDDVVQALGEKAGLDTERVYGKADLGTAATEEVRFLFGTWGFEGLNAQEIATYFPKLEAVFYAAGSVQGFARPFLASGVRVFSAWAANAVPVAEFTLAQILLANKGFFRTTEKFSRGDRDGLDRIKNAYPGNYNCKVGIIGAGMIGKLVIELLKRHHVQVLVYDPFLPDETAAALGVEKTTLERLFSECQTVSNHLANNAQTVGMLNGALFEKMKYGATFLNTGRGAQVVEDDLCRVLEQRPDLTAVLDVTDPEPPLEGSRFFTLPNVVLTPHIAGSIGTEVQRLSVYMLEECERLLGSGDVRYEVTESMLATMA